MKLKRLSIIVATLLIVSAGNYSFAQDAPKPFGPIPSKGQMQWHRTELFGLVHFSTTTYANLEWGYGDEPAAHFNPVEFNSLVEITVIVDEGIILLYPPRAR